MLLGLVLTLLVPVARGREVTTITIEPAKPGEAAEAGQAHDSWPLDWWCGHKDSAIAIHPIHSRFHPED